jgi:glycosyltransferase 2 family protein
MEKAFASWKIYLAILVGLSFTGYLLYRSLSQTHFIATSPNKGTYCWIDNNHNNKIDSSDPLEFNICKSGDYKKEQLGDIVSTIHWNGQSFLWIFLAILCMFARDLAYMLRIRILTHNKLSWKSSFNVILLWEFASALSPGVVGGATVAMFILNKEKINLGRSTSIVMITALLDNLFFILLIPFVFLFISPEILFPNNDLIDKSIALVFWGGFGIIFLVCLALFLSVFIFPKAIGSILTLLCRIPLLTKFQPKIKALDSDLQTTSHVMRSEKISFWLGSFGATIISWSCRYFVINCVLAAFLSLSFFDHFFILGKQLVLWIFMLVSPTPGGSGIAEFAFGELMGSFSASAILIVGLAVLWRLISYFPYLIIGAILLPNWLKKKSEMHQ